ncbi:MAG: BlaI/MecI/CopY family transcriptional regulator [Alphaproteobacteria bacterium]|jgi:predicted transcriptional regulator|nr:BlaI/MecI/CopY family transcriptional regulator [Alphaproteobacteria bacterium]MBU2042008.1 BlaI/MecI/CopY family transcriptional regulator [Alphaproteobacteria bacterium]MBU2292259.1 BlaI/MecI/CopY family transcriptional regulator [Alphaproteobacteria bacterium]
MIETLPRREREVFEVLCRLEEGTTGAVRAAMTGALSDSAVRTLLARLETKGLVGRRTAEDGLVYRPTQRPQALAAGALRRTVDTFFAGSAVSAATALLGLTQKLKPEEIAALERAIEQARERGS